MRTTRGRSSLLTGLFATTALATAFAGGIIATAPATAAPAEPAGITGSVAPADTVGATNIKPDQVSAKVAVAKDGTTLGAITKASQDGASATFTAEHGTIRVTFLSPTTFRIEATESNDFTDPANSESNDPTRTANIVVGEDDFPGATPTLSEGETTTFATSAVSVSIDTKTGTLAAHRSDGTTLWEEESPLTFSSASTTQHLKIHDGEQFLGGGMQNGRSIHTGSSINIASNFDWDDDGYPNAVPYYMSSAGYGVLRDTFAPGTYNFKTGTTTHAEDRFDAYYFAGDYTEALNSYTKLTGRPLLPPIYALEYGDADCYNRSSEDYSGTPVEGKLHTIDAVKTAQGFVDNDMPGGWMLVNDGYGCGYSDLPETVSQIQDKTDLQVGLWTENDLTNQEFEVAEAGIRMRKLDVAWVGSGYRMALTACEKANKGIEDNSNARGTALMVEGWAGSQRCGMQWTGDHSGNLDAVRWQVSALTGAGNSGLAFTTGDVDGIFGGSTDSYIRDLQWKAFAPALYSMSGWAATDKRPWLYGEEATKINRSYLQLRQQLMPYLYDVAENSHATGAPMIRSLAINYPKDPGSYSQESNTEFMLGNVFLAAPVYSDTTVRDGIYLPEGQTWIDYWSGKRYDGGQVINGYDAPLEKLPLFVRAGSVVPMGPVARNASLVPEDAPLTISAYPSGDSTFNLYEDDKVTRGYESGEHSTQDLAVSAPVSGSGDVTFTIGARKGSYNGMAGERPYQIEAHAVAEPSQVLVNGTSIDEIEAGSDELGWYFDDGAVHVNVGSVASASSATVTLKDSSAVGGSDPDADAAQVRVSAPATVYQGDEATITASFRNSGDQPKTDVELTPNLPQGWTVSSAEGASVDSVAAGKTVEATFVVVPGKKSAGGSQTVRVSAAYTSASGKQMETAGAKRVNVAYGSLAAAFNAISITDAEHASEGNFDGGGNTFASEAITAAGVEPGGTLTLGEGDDAVNYDWPESTSSANSLEPSGQRIAVDGTGTHLSFLGSAAAGNGANLKVNVEYTDGTTTSGEVFFPNWLPQASGLGSAQVAIKSMGRHNPDGELEYEGYGYQIYENSLTLIPGKQIRSITLPASPSVRIFSMAVVDRALPDAPTGENWVSDLDWVSATNGWGVIGIDSAVKGSEDEAGEPLVSYWVDPETGEHRTYEKGLGVHANGKIRYYLGGNCTSFTAEATQENGFGGNVVFSVEGDGKVLFSGRTLTSEMSPDVINVDVSGMQYLDLIISAPNGIGAAHGIWGDAKLVCAADQPDPGGDDEAGADGTDEADDDQGEADTTAAEAGADGTAEAGADGTDEADGDQGEADTNAAEAGADGTDEANGDEGEADANGSDPDDGKASAAGADLSADADADGDQTDSGTGSEGTAGSEAAAQGTAGSQGESGSESESGSQGTAGSDKPTTGAEADAGSEANADSGETSGTETGSSSGSESGSTSEPGSESGSQSTADSDDLASTGTSPFVPLGITALLLGAGASALVIRRRASHH